MGMAEYIERKEAIAAACKGCNKEFPNEPCEPSECHIQQGLFNIPAAGVVPVVRCKDCKYYMLWEDSEDKRTCSKSIGLMISDPDDFCSYGERR